MVEQLCFEFVLLYIYNCIISGSDDDNITQDLHLVKYEAEELGLLLNNNFKLRLRMVT